MCRGGILDRDSIEVGSGALESRLAAGLAKIGLALRHHAWQQAGINGVTPTQAQILACLRATSDTGLTLSAIAERIAVTPATASDAVTALARKGLLVKERSGEDARALRVRLTEEGQRAADATAGWPDFLAAATSAMSPDEQVTFLRGLVKMIRNLQVRGQIPIAQMCVTCRFFQPFAHPSELAPHHCDYVDLPFGDAAIRLDCPDHLAASPDRADEIWLAFAQPR